MGQVRWAGGQFGLKPRLGADWDIHVFSGSIDRPRPNPKPAASAAAEIVRVGFEGERGKFDFFV